MLSARKHSEPTAIYRYTDRHGKLLYEVLRFGEGKGKSFRQRRPGPSDSWIWNLDGVARVPYRLPELRREIEDGDGLVFVVEGEKDADRLAAAGLCATTSAGGAGWRWTPSFVDHFDGARLVVVLADDDPPGRRAAMERAEALQTVVEDVRVLVLDDAGLGVDVSDWLDAGHTVAELLDLAERATPPRTPAQELAARVFVDWPTFWATEHADEDWAVEPVLARRRGHAVYAPAKSGKSLLALKLALDAVRRGLVVVYLDFEMGPEDLRERLERFGLGPNDDLSRLHYALLPDLPPLDSAEGGEVVEALVAATGADIVVIDTTARAVVGEENAADTLRAFWTHTGARLKRAGVTWLRVDHAGKDLTRGQRGTSAKRDDVDVVWRLVPRDAETVELVREASRVTWIPERVAWRIRVDDEDVVRWVRVDETWPAGTAECAADLDALGVPVDAPVRIASAALRMAGKGRRWTTVSAAQRWRRRRAEERGGP